MGESVQTWEFLDRTTFLIHALSLKSRIFTICCCCFERANDRHLSSSDDDDEEEEELESLRLALSTDSTECESGHFFETFLASLQKGI